MVMEKQFCSCRLQRSDCLFESWTASQSLFLGLQHVADPHTFVFCHVFVSSVVSFWGRSRQASSIHTNVAGHILFQATCCSEGLVCSSGGSGFCTGSSSLTKLACGCSVCLCSCWASRLSHSTHALMCTCCFCQGCFLAQTATRVLSAHQHKGIALTLQIPVDWGVNAFR